MIQGPAPSQQLALRCRRSDLILRPGARLRDRLMGLQENGPQGPVFPRHMVERRRIELPTSALRTQRSPS